MQFLVMKPVPQPGCFNYSFPGVHSMLSSLAPSQRFESPKCSAGLTPEFTVEQDDTGRPLALQLLVCLQLFQAKSTASDQSNIYLRVCFCRCWLGHEDKCRNDYMLRTTWKLCWGKKTDLVEQFNFSEQSYQFDH